MNKIPENFDSCVKAVANDDLLAVARWLCGNDTGVSSKYMAAVALAGKPIKSQWGDSTPQDAPDLGRCVRLIEKAPGVRDTFPALREASAVWAAFVDHWDELTVLWHHGGYHETTDRMNALRSSANVQGMARRDGRPPCQDGLSPSPSPSCSPLPESPKD
jgi:hypothetical protein